jgi:kojibiose phosphorylase
LGGPQQIHINADVAYACHQFWLATGDHDFWFSKGLEILFGTARYWASRVQPATSSDEVAFEIRKVIGPDEGHSSINNNLYTNAMAAWNLRAAAKEARQLLKDTNTSSEQRQRFQISASECSQWEKIATGLKLNYDPHSKLYEQFDGYFKHPNPRVKQSDVLLALYLLPELQRRGSWKANFKYYYPLTDHGSSLSPGLHVLFALLADDIEMAYKFFKQACDIDGVYAPGQSDKGIHAAACGAGWLATIRGFGGIEVDRKGNLKIAPKMPSSWQKLNFAFWHQRRRLRVEIENERVTVTAEHAEKPLKFILVDKPVTIKANQTLTARLKNGK